MKKYINKKRYIILIAVLVLILIPSVFYGINYYKDSEESSMVIKDKNGFCIENGVLYAYVGKNEEIIIPSNVTEIYSNALSGDYNHGINLKKVTIPGTVERIDDHAFAFTNAKYIYIEEGVKEIGSNAFQDSYIKEIHFPSSIEEIGELIMDTEEGLYDTKIYIEEDSAIHEYFKKKMPYGDVEICFEN
ncbi:putative membrane protein [Clostridium bornimense]|uniref:Putative membrane protein n=1 Tax=Clostridium bornimense TaxID=1216932 RepID=W6RXU3_9CLOT|nr:leucine-rich repeat domain-containing protein [Clostridium bornimense]CDM68414.1 putative membrane protein [Clostridium bornimense]